MDEKKTNFFQIGVIGLFIALGVVGVFLFATIREKTEAISSITVSVWGTVETNTMAELLKLIDDTNESAPTITYAQHDPRFFYQEVVEAIATGKGPDLIMVDQGSISSYLDKIYPISFESFPQRVFLDTYVDAGSVFMNDTSIVAIPFSIDPMVMYWNKDFFATNGIALPPKYWDEIFPLIAKLTKITNTATISLSAVALGEYANVTNAKGILSTLMLQAGTPMVVWGGDALVPQLTADFSYPVMPSYAALAFYTDFSNPLRKAYSWNRSLKSSRDAFLAGELAMYFGYASEFRELRDANPNLNFDMAAIPQARTATRRSTYAAITGFAIPKTSQNPAAAFATAGLLSGADTLAILAKESNLPPVRRDLVSIPQTNAYSSILYDAAIISRSWLEPSPSSVDRIFGRMVDSITSGRAGIGDAISEAQRDLEEAFKI